MTTQSLPAFFVAGGTVPPGTPSYVERAADRELFEALRAGEYAYVLNSRQMGKSSLAVRTIARLADAGVRTAFVDLTRLGGATVNPEQWYAGLLVETGRALGLRTEAAAYLREERSVGPAQRFLGFLQEVALGRFEEPVVIMIDEIDAVRSLGFSTDELFAGIRQLHNGRASDPALRRLTFCLLGSALPSDLIRDPRTTPFNVGRRIELRDFSPEEARPLAAALGAGGTGRLERVLEWTGGHPFLTQSLCAEIARTGEGDVDRLVAAQYLDARARETDTNLADVGNRLLGRGDPTVDDADRADALGLFAKMLRGGIADDEANPAAARIKMSGVACLTDGRLFVRNRIYRRVFGPAWIRENMPGQELRRQRKAFWKGALRVAAVAALVVSAVGFLAGKNALLAAENAHQRDAARYQAYAASMQTLSIHRDLNDYAGIEDLLEANRDSPHRGWEWDFWNRLVHREAWRVPLTPGVDRVCPVSADRRRLAVLRKDALLIVEVETGKTLRSFPPPVPDDREAFVWWMRDGRRLLLRSAGDTFSLMDSETGRVERLGSLPRRTFPLGDSEITTPDDRAFLIAGAGLELYRVEIPSLRIALLRPSGADLFGDLHVSQNGRFIAGAEGIDLKGNRTVSVRRTTDGREIHRVTLPFPVDEAVTLSAGDRLLASGNGALHLVDARTGRVLWSLPLGVHGVLHRAVPSLDERFAAVPSTDGVTRLVALSEKGGKLLQEFHGGWNGFLSRDDRVLVTVGTSVRGFVLDRPEEVPERRVPQIASAGAYIVPSGTLYAAGTADHVLDLAQPDAPLREVSKLLPSEHLLATGRHLIRADGPEIVVREARPGGRVVLLAPGRIDEVLATASYDGRWIVFPGDGATLDAYDLQTERRAARLRPPKSLVGTNVSHDGRRFAAVGAMGEIAVWDVPSWKPLWARNVGGTTARPLSSRTMARGSPSRLRPPRSRSGTPGPASAGRSFPATRQR